MKIIYTILFVLSINIALGLEKGIEYDFRPNEIFNYKLQRTQIQQKDSVNESLDLDFDIDLHIESVNKKGTANAIIKFNEINVIKKKGNNVVKEYNSEKANNEIDFLTVGYHILRTLTIEVKITKFGEIQSICGFDKIAPLSMEYAEKHKIELKSKEAAAKALKYIYSNDYWKRIIQLHFIRTDGETKLKNRIWTNKCEFAINPVQIAGLVRLYRVESAENGEAHITEEGYFKDTDPPLYISGNSNGISKFDIKNSRLKNMSIKFELNYHFPNNMKWEIECRTKLIEVRNKLGSSR